MAARALFDDEFEDTEEENYLAPYARHVRYERMQHILNVEQDGGAHFGNAPVVEDVYGFHPTHQEEHPELVRRVIYEEQYGGDENAILYDRNVLPVEVRARIEEHRDLREERNRRGVVDRKTLLHAIDQLQAGEIYAMKLDYDDIKGDVFGLVNLLPLRNEVETDKYVIKVLDAVIVLNPQNRVRVFNALKSISRKSVDRLFDLFGVENEIGSANCLYENLKALARLGGSAFVQDNAHIVISRLRTIDELSIRKEDREKQKEEKKRAGRYRNRVAGAAFKYHHKVQGLDLKRYQIFHVDDDFLNDEKLLEAANTPCLVYALRRAGMPDDQCDHLRQTMARKCRTISKLDIKRICKLLRVRIWIYLERTSRDKQKGRLGKFLWKKYPESLAKANVQDTQGWPLYKICLIRDHYMVYDDDTGIFTENLSEKSLRGPETKNDFFYKKRPATGRQSPETTSNLVRYLFKHKSRLLTHVTKREVYIKTWHYEQLRNDFSDLSYNDEIHALPYGTRIKLEEIYDEKEIRKQTAVKKMMKESRAKKDESRAECVKRDIEDSGRKLCFAFDFETATDGDVHVPYMVACQRIPEPKFELDDAKDLPITIEDMKSMYTEQELQEFEPKVFHGPDCAVQMQLYIVQVWLRHQRQGKRVMNEKGDLQRMFKHGILLIAHNAGYDLRFLLDTFVAWGGDPTFTAQGSNLKSFEGYWPEDRFCKRRWKENEARANAGLESRKRTREERKLVKVQVHDSLNFTMCALKKFPKMFHLEKMVKEIMPYELYTRDLVYQAHKENEYKVLYPVTKALSFLSKVSANNPKANYAAKFGYQGCCEADVRKTVESDLRQFKENLHKWNCVEVNQDDGEEYFDIIKYSSEYCKLDVKILAQGYAVLRHMFYVVTDGLNIDGFVSVNHLTNKYLQNYGCTEGVYELSGVPREFIQKCVTGGKCMLRNNEVQRYEGKIADFDAVSLYPSAMAEMPGLVKGKPKVIPEHGLSYEWLDNATQGGKKGAWFAEVRITKVGKKWQMPICNEKTKTGRNFTNDMEGKVMHCSHVVAQDMRQFQDIEMDILKGYYFDEGYNEELNTFITGIFNERLKMKKTKNPMQLVYKLMMNGCYGRLILKPIDEEVKFVRRDFTKTDEENKENAMAHVIRSWTSVKTYCKLRSKCPWSYLIKKSKPMYSHWAAPHLGVMILDYSKRIMNRLHDMAYEHNWPIFYMDTDSMHLRDEDVRQMAIEFKKKYPHINDGELIGKKLGQFHNDFDLSAIGPVKLPQFDEHEVRSRKFVAFGKKCYMHELYVPSDDSVYGMSIAMKGFTENAIYDCCLQNNLTLAELYQKVFEGNKYEANLLAGNRVSFRYNSDFSVCSVKEMHRTIARTGVVAN